MLKSFNSEQHTYIPFTLEKLNKAWIFVLGGPEDDRLGRNMSPGHIYLTYLLTYSMAQSPS